MTAKNDITGDKIKSRLQSESYATGWDRIFGKKDQDDADECQVEVPQRSIGTLPTR